MSPLNIKTIWLLLPVVGVVCAATLEPIPPHDYWWHLAMGRLIDAGSIPDSNRFLYTLAADMPFVDQPWLGQWLMFKAYDGMGHGAGVWLRNGLLGAAFAVLVAIAWLRSRDARAVGATGLLAAIIAYPVLTVRTRMFAFLPFAVVLAVALGVRDGLLSKRWLWAIPIATAFWANTHGSFVLATIVVGAVAVGDVVQGALDKSHEPALGWSTWVAVVLSTLVAGCLTPLGVAGYEYVFQLAVQSSVASSVTEWQPPNVAELRGQVFLAAACATVALLVARRRAVSLGDALLFGGTLVLAAGAIRSVFWWGAVLIPCVAPVLAAVLPAADDAEPTSAERGLVAGLMAALLIAVLAPQPGIARSAIGEATQPGYALRAGDGAWLLNHEHAVEAIDKIRRDGRQRVFHDQVLGGMLEFGLAPPGQPQQVAFVDQRMEFVPDEVWSVYFALSRAQKDWQRELDRHGVDTLLLSARSQWPLLQAAMVSNEWEVVHTGQSHTLLYRR